MIITNETRDKGKKNQSEDTLILIFYSFEEWVRCKIRTSSGQYNFKRLPLVSLIIMSSLCLQLQLLLMSVSVASYLKDTSFHKFHARNAISDIYSMSAY